MIGARPSEPRSAPEVSCGREQESEQADAGLTVLAVHYPLGYLDEVRDGWPE